MRIKISHHDVTEGRLFRRTWYEVHVSVDFTHEERHIIHQRGLENAVVLDRRPADARDDDPDDLFALTVQNLVHRKPDRFRCKRPSEAKRYEEALVDALHMVKRWLDDNAETGVSRVIEL